MRRTHGSETLNPGRSPGRRTSDGKLPRPRVLMAQQFLPAAHWHFLTPLYEAIVRPVAAPIWRRLADEVRQRAPRGGEAVDIGCGPGTVLGLVQFQRPDLRLTGLDID